MINASLKDNKSGKTSIKVEFKAKKGDKCNFYIGRIIIHSEDLMFTNTDILKK